MGLGRGAISAWITRWERQLGWVVCGLLAIGFAVGAALMVDEAGIERAYVGAPVCNVANVLDSAATGTCTRGDRTVETVTEIGSETVVRQVGRKSDDTTTTVTLQLTDQTGLLTTGSAGYATGSFTDQDTPAAGTASAPQSLVAQVWRGEVDWVQDGRSGPRAYSNVNPAATGHALGIGLLGIFSALCFLSVLLRWRLGVLWWRDAEPAPGRRLIVPGVCLAVAVGSMVILGNWIMLGLIPLGLALVVTAAQPYLWRRSHPAEGLLASSSFFTPGHRRNRPAA